LPFCYLIEGQAANRLSICFKKGLVMQPSPENTSKKLDSELGAVGLYYAAAKVVVVLLGVTYAGANESKLMSQR